MMNTDAPFFVPHCRRGAQATDALLSDAILKCIVNGPESISFIHKTLQSDGWRGLGVLAEFEWKCKHLGFTVRDGRNARGQKRTEVTL